MQTILCRYAGHFSRCIERIEQGSAPDHVGRAWERIKKQEWSPLHSFAALVKELQCYYGASDSIGAALLCNSFDVLDRAAGASLDKIFLDNLPIRYRSWQNPLSHLTAFALSSVALQAIIPQKWQVFSKLKRLKVVAPLRYLVFPETVPPIEQLFLADTCLETCPGMTTLQDLTLEQDTISLGCVQSICAFSSLQRLSFSGQLPGRLPDAFGALTSLVYLEIVSPTLQELPSTFSALTKLRTLAIMKTQIQEVPFDMKGFTQLKVLDLFKNQFHKLPELSQLSSLKKLNIAANPLDSFPLNLFNKTASVEVRMDELCPLPQLGYYPFSAIYEAYQRSVAPRPTPSFSLAALLEEPRSKRTSDEGPGPAPQPSSKRYHHSVLDILKNSPP